MAEATVQMRGIRKQFPSCLANDNVDFTAYRGEIHALLGENGAGKSTLMSILTGVLQPDAGEICINGKPVMIRTPKDALQHGIGMIYQHFKLVKPFSVAENIVLGDDHVKVINKKKLEARVKALSERYCIEIDPGALTWQLSIGEQQRVEILKVLYRNANILILDEPTAVLTAQEVQELFLTLRKMTDSGCTVIFITHKMNEVMDYADRITVLRDGCLVRTLTKAETDEKELAKLMVSIGTHHGRRVAAMITDMDTPLGHNIGNSLEVMESMDVLKGHGPADLTEVCLQLAANMLVLADKGSPAECRAMAEAVIADGSAFAKCKEMFAAQGGDTRVLDDYSLFEKPAASYELLAEEDGYIVANDAEKIGSASVLLGAGRQKKGDPLDFAAGIILHKKRGDYVHKGESLATFYGAADKFDAAAAEYRSGLVYGPEKPEEAPLVYALVTKDGVERY